jgi:DNA-directed RNA polymerase subunit RPC12/RpoP
MIKRLPDKACPKCGSSDLVRIPRRLWMHLILGSRNYLCLHCQDPFFYSDSTIDAGLFLTISGIVLVLVTFAIDTFVIDDPGTHFVAIVSYVFSLMIITFGIVFIHLSR